MKPAFPILLPICLAALFALLLCRAASAESAQRKKLRVVVFGAHCDDPETGAGGLIAMLTQAGHEVICAYATTFRGDREIKGQPEDTVRRAESTAACKILGAKPTFFPYAHEHLWANEKILGDVRAWFEKIKPDVVIAHWPFDSHPNHHVVGSLAWLCYAKEGGWNLYFYEVYTGIQSLGFRPELYLDIEPVIDVKKRAVDCMVSQTPAELWTMHDKMHRNRGRECGVQRAEAYFLLEAKKGCPLLPVGFVVKK
jgi:LmbE family N-acetylglucosaminyl deacetylase